MDVTKDIRRKVSVSSFVSRVMERQLGVGSALGPAYKYNPESFFTIRALTIRMDSQ